ncbi:MAG TPA: RsmD family RNA methyltransferase, partial [Hyphomicrobiaceae bacterium]|nr:RsmD family RNA methyltransferase [Hyphomicrobiaceae bacterium]
DAHRIARLTIGRELCLMTARPELDLGGVRVTPPPGTFVQAVEMAEQAMRSEVLAGACRGGRFADLFAGVGTFALPLARLGRVMAIDNDRSALAAIEEAGRRNPGLKPIEVRARDLMRDPLSPRELDQFDVVVLDPPRVGAKSQAEALARSKVPRVIAVSCNPATLVRDLAVLAAGGYAIERATPIDQFLFTPHLEAVVVLSRRKR